MLDQPPVWVEIRVSRSGSNQFRHRFMSFGMGWPCLADADRRVRTHYHTANRGISADRNTALAAARDEWVCYLDHDDGFDPKYFARIYAHQDEGDVLFFHYRLVDEQPDSPRFGTTYVHDPAPLLPEFDTTKSSIPLGVAHRLSLLEVVGMFDTRLPRSASETEGHELWKRFK